jgi:hypothetical protein
MPAVTSVAAWIKALTGVGYKTENLFFCLDYFILLLKKI